MWHVTRHMWHMTNDKWQVGGGRGTENLKPSNRIGFWIPNPPTERAKLRNILKHIIKVSRVSNICLYILQDNLEPYIHPSRPFYCSSILPSPLQPLDCWTFSWPAIREFDPASTNHWTVWHSTVNHWSVWHSIIQPLDSWTQDCLTIGQLEKAPVWPLDFWTLSSPAIGHRTQHKPTIGLLDTTLSNHWTVVYNTVQLLTVWQNIVRHLNNCPTISMLDTALSNHLHN